MRSGAGMRGRGAAGPGQLHCELELGEGQAAGGAQGGAAGGRVLQGEPGRGDRTGGVV